MEPVLKNEDAESKNFLVSKLKHNRQKIVSFVKNELGVVFASDDCDDCVVYCLVLVFAVLFMIPLLDLIFFRK